MSINNPFIIATLASVVVVVVVVSLTCHFASFKKNYSNWIYSFNISFCKLF